MSDVMIDLARICVPYPTGFTRTDQTYGIKVLGYDKLMYNYFKDVGNVLDDAGTFKSFYDIVSAAYSVDLTKVPPVRPLVSWIDWCKKNGGVLMHGGTEQQKKILKEANTLICGSVEERDFLAHLYMNMARTLFDDYLFDYRMPVPARFSGIKDLEIARLVNRWAFPVQQKVK